MIGENGDAGHSRRAWTPRRWLNQDVIPAMIDGFATVELTLEKLAEQVARRPLSLLGLAILGGAAMACIRPGRTFRR